ncbi:tricorn protease [Dysgonomonadaceae bacterium PH5-43]|nr:tricorn protease [Dysgonomonadaceae bacterium PH5-43]
MNKIKLIVLSLLFSITVFANPLWMRYPSLSPDGQTIAFAYKGDIYTVDAKGGEAKQITLHSAHDYMPIWSPDSKNIAFASNRFGGFDVFIVSANGGTPMRLTTFSGNELPLSFTPDGKSIAFSAKIQAPAQSAAFPSGVVSEIYKVPVSGGRTEQILAISADAMSFASDGKSFVYQDRKGFEDKWRKHHTSSTTRDILFYDANSQKHTILSSYAGENTDPVLSTDNSTVYFLNEQSGSFNVWAMPLNNPNSLKQITNFKTHPVRFLSIDKAGKLCFWYDGEIYTMAASGKPEKVKISIIEDDKLNDFETINRGAYAEAVSSDGKQVASVMRGEIFVSSVDYKYTKRITNTAAKDAMPSFSPDGKTLVYASERTGVWSLYTAKTGREEEPFFFNATLIEEEPLFKESKTERVHPEYSPDGKKIAFIQDRHKVMVYNIDSKKTTEITDGSDNANSSGDIHFEWSPDSKWLAITYSPNKHDPYYDIGLVSAEGGEVINLTNSGYTDVNPKWVLDGNAILFLSERYGMRNHASWGSLNDAFLVFMNQEAYDKYRLSEDDYKLFEEEKKLKSKDKAAEKDSTKKDDKSIKIELKNIEDRIVRVTPNSSNLADAMLTKDGSKLYYLSAFEKDYDLWSINTRTRETKIEIKGAGRGRLNLDKDGKILFSLGSSAQKITLAGNKKETININASMDLDLAAERQYMFDHVWTQEDKRFYVKDLHGVNWKLMKTSYEKFLPHINNNFDFCELLGEMLGELNSSHNGARYSPRYNNPDVTANLGLLFSWTYNKDGLLIDEVLEKGPFDTAESKVKAGCILTALNGVEIKKDEDYFPLLNKIAGQNTLCSFSNPETNEKWDEVIKPISIGTANSLLYTRWVKQREADVERLSNGRLGYVHIQSMADPSFRSIYSDILGKFNNKEGIVIDTRYNGGGRLHEDIEILFSGKKYFTQVVRDVETCDMPSRRWNKPSVMIMGEANYSNAHGSPWVYKHVGIGKLVGMPVPGTMTSVSWENLQDPSLLFGIPIVGYKLADGSYLENQQLEPDVKIANSPEKLVKGEDEQLAKAVSVLLEELKR